MKKKKPQWERRNDYGVMILGRVPPELHAVMTRYKEQHGVPIQFQMRLALIAWFKERGIKVEVD